TRRVLYRLRELIKGKDPVFLVEGEKDVDNLREWGLTVTCNPMGAQKWKSQEKEYNPFLKGREVIIIPDNDLLDVQRDLIIDKHLVGERHLIQVASSVQGLARTVKVLRLPESKDFSDWKAKDKTNIEEKFLILAADTPEWKEIKKETIRNIKELEGEIGKRKKKAPPVIARKEEIKPIGLEDLLDTFKKWLELEETEYIEIILATILSNQIPGDPVWLFIIGAPGASKTEILRSFKDIESIYTTSKLT
ncbi:unnamed protein product, partial [marine sediment metagenome]